MKFSPGARRRAGLKRATCHQLRHTCLTRLRESGMALEAIQAQAGHVSIESTRIYLHLAAGWLVDEYRKAVDILDALPAGDPSWTPPPSHPPTTVTSTPSPMSAAPAVVTG